MFRPDGQGGGKASTARETALVALLRRLKASDYRFVTPTPATHSRVLARRPGPGVTSADIFGWSRPFDPAALDGSIMAALTDGGLIDRRADGLVVSRVRVSSLGGDLFVHSAYPTEEPDAVFFGPDSYRFADLIRRELARCPEGPGRLLDIGAGAGVGAIVAARACPETRLTLTDINPLALEMARANLAAAGLSADLALGSGLAGVKGAFDVILANPPYIMDEGERAYRDGGGLHGAQVALDMAEAAVARLAAGGRFILYTGSAIVDGCDGLANRLAALAEARGCTLDYREIDPDVFGEELDRPAYADVDRIALVAAVIHAA